MMKGLEEQNHYEILELPVNARGEEIERAYRLALGTYASDSLATYSVFDSGDTDVITQRIELAYRILSDSEARERYDLSLGDELKADSPESLEVREPDEPARVLPPIQLLASSFEDVGDDAEEEAGDFDGARLRRSRLRRGVEIERISEITKISPAYLRCIEEESFADLPAEVYVRGFVTAYAQTIGLDGSRVANDYMGRFRAAVQAKPRGFLRNSR